MFIRRKDEPGLSVLASAEVTLDGRRVCRQELMYLLYGGVIRLAYAIGECGGREPLHGGIDRCGRQHEFNADC